MSNNKITPRYNVISMRVSDEEKEAFDKLMQRTRKSASSLMREAIQQYFWYTATGR